MTKENFRKLLKGDVVERVTDKERFIVIETDEHNVFLAQIYNENFSYLLNKVERI